MGVASDVGRVRELNEDSLIAQYPVFAVADGMGGHAAGEVASALTVGVLGQLGGRADVSPADVEGALADANRTILARVAEHAATAGMGTTVSGVCLGRDASRWIVFNVGDSRVYRFADGLLEQLTVDHSEVAELVAAGWLTREQARSHPMRNVVTRSMGSDPAPIPDIWSRPLDPGERFLICTDGLNSEVDDAGIAELLHQVPDAQQCAETLVRAAVDAGGRDNVSVIVVDLPRSMLVAGCE
ncbi:MAG: protein phosphatase 2C domain-containing protein [Jatrophihabitantaceae bacterium]